MPRSSPIQTSFAGGEVSPRVRGHVDAEVYRHALANATNCEITPHGTLGLRPGSIFLANLGNDPRMRLISFPQSDDQDYLLVLDHLSMRVFTADGGVPVAAGASGLSFLVNGDFASGHASWTEFETSSPAYVRFANSDLQLHGERTMGGVTNRAAVYQDFTPANTVAATLRINWKSTTGHVRLVEVLVTQGTDTIAQWTQYPTPGSTTEIGVPLEAGKVYRLRLKLDVTSGSFTDTWSADVVIDSVSLTASSGGTSPSYRLTTPWSAAQLAALRWAVEPGRNRIYFVHPNVTLWFLERNIATGAWTWQSATFTNPPVEWASANWPAVAEVYQGRLWLAATPDQGNTIWASRSLDPFDFSMNDGASPPVVTPSHAIAAPIATKGRVRWLRGRSMLLVGTTEGECSVTASGGVITPSDIQVRQESAFGSASAPAVDLGDQVLYVSRDGRKARPLDFSTESDSWQSHDLTFLAEHLTKPGIREMAFARDPGSLLALVLNDGTLACCTYNRPEHLAAWAPWNLGTESGSGTAGVGGVISAAVTEGRAGSILFLLVQRASGVLLEYFQLSEATRERPYCDAAVFMTVDPDAAFVSPDPWDPTRTYVATETVEYNGYAYIAVVVLGVGPTVGVPPDQDPVHWPREYVVLPGTDAATGHLVLVGLPHLEGCTVTAVVDGTVMADLTVEDGRLELEVPGTSIIVGLPYAGLAKTLPPEGGNPAGTAQGAKRRWSRIIVRLNESARPLVNDERATERSPATPMDTAEPLFTGDVPCRGGTWADEGQITIEMDLPLRTEILALFGELQVNK